MKKLFTSTLFTAFVYLGVFAQQPVTWPITGNGTSPSSSWAAINYDASSKVEDGIWNLYQPVKVAAETAKNCFIQYNPGYTGLVTNSTITTDRSVLRYFIINLKNNTANTTATFYYRINPTAPGHSGSYKAFPFTISANDTEFKTYIIDLNDISDWNTHFTIMPIIRVDIPNVALPVYTVGNTPSLVASIDYMGFSANTTLPVSLTSFTAQKQNNGIGLNWSTASEKDNSHFDILRSGDGANFEKISSVAGNGNSSEVRNYNFTDANPLPGINYYQLSQVDTDGKSSKSEIRAVNSGIKNIDFKVLTDINNNIKASVFSLTNAQVKLLITDASGRKISDKTHFLSKGQNALEVSSELTAGIYVATIQSGGETVSTKFLAQ
jgi:hypothetical protein